MSRRLIRVNVKSSKNIMEKLNDCPMNSERENYKDLLYLRKKGNATVIDAAEKWDVNIGTEMAISWLTLVLKNIKS